LLKIKIILTMTILTGLNQHKASPVITITGFPEPGRDFSLYRDDFRTLNEEWLNRYFTIEPHDRLLLDDPEQQILSRGGYIFFALDGKKAVGTCALIKEDDAVYELAKLGVTEAYKGKGLGEKLCRAVIDKAKSVRAKTLYLVSSSRLLPALTLYRKLGFRNVEMAASESEYRRADIKMMMEMQPSGHPIKKLR
jgi:putative acetyltransferase